MLTTRWIRMLLVASLVGIVALISNITTIAQLSGEANTLLTMRFTLSKIVNSGTVWGGLLILAGWLVRRPIQAAVAGVVAGEVALIVHYGLGRVLEIAGPSGWVEVYSPSVWLDNWYWFVAPVLFGPPLALIGAGAHRPDAWGLLARLVVPLAAVIEPFFIGMFRLPAMLPAPDRLSSALAGGVLIAAGVIGAAAVVRNGWRRSGSRPDANVVPPARDHVNVVPPARQMTRTTQR